MYLLYRYYSTGPTRDFAYFKALGVIVLLIYLHIFQILILLGVAQPLFATFKNDLQITKYGKMAIFLLPLFLLIYFLVKPKDIKDLKYDHSKIKRGNIYLITYSISSFILLFALAFIFARR